MKMAIEDEEEEDNLQQIKRSKTSHISDDPQPIPTLLTEIIVEILSKLPVESLLRCKSVSKLWNSLISDPHFIKSHLNSSSKSPLYQNHRLIYSTVPRINLKTSRLHSALFENLIHNTEVDYPLKHPNKSVWIAGSCNGLLCIAIEEDTLFIWNPSTRKSNRLPYCGFKVRSGWYVLYGFGYDEVNDDYKVVGMTCLIKNGNKYETVVKIFSLKFGNWKKIGDFPHGVPLDDSGKFSNGALHWAASRDFGDSYSWTIVSLNLATEKYGEILQPEYGGDEGEKDKSLGVVGDLLCVVCNFRGVRADVWLMKEYGVKDSWSRLVSVPYLVDPVRDQFSVPLCVTNDGRVLLQFGSKFVVFDSKSGLQWEIENFDECLEACTYVESMVSPDGPVRVWR